MQPLLTFGGQEYDLLNKELVLKQPLNGQEYSLLSKELVPEQPLPVLCTLLLCQMFR